MADDSTTPGDRIGRIEGRLDEIAAAVGAVADRLETMQQEAQRSATQLHRLGLNQESAKLAAERQNQTLCDVAEALALINQALTRRL